MNKLEYAFAISNILKALREGIEKKNEDELRRLLDFKEVQDLFMEHIRGEWPFNLTWKPVSKGKYNRLLGNKASKYKDVEVLLGAYLMYEKGFGKREVIDLVKENKSGYGSSEISQLLLDVISKLSYDAIMYFKASAVIRVTGCAESNCDDDKFNSVYDMMRFSYCVILAWLLLCGVTPKNSNSILCKSIVPCIDNKAIRDYCRLEISVPIDKIPPYGIGLLLGKTVLEEPEIFTRSLEDECYDDFRLPIFKQTFISCLVTLQVELIEMSGEREGALIKQLESKDDEIVRLTKVNADLHNELDNTRRDTASIEKIEQRYNDEIDDLIEENARLLEKLESATALINMFRRTVTEDEFETKEIEALEEIDSVNISGLRILVICKDDYKSVYDFDTYDYIKAPQRIDMLLKYDIVVLAVPYIKHKHSVAVVEFCRLHKIEFMYINNLNKERVEESIKNYVRYKNLA